MKVYKSRNPNKLRIGALFVLQVIFGVLPAILFVIFAFDNMQLSERSREQILSMKGNTHDGYDITLKTGETHHFRTKLEIRKFFSGCLAQDSQSLAQDI